MTGDEKYLTTAKRFSHKMLLDPMAEGHDNLDNKHANTQIPKVTGFQRIAEVTHDEKYVKAASFFWKQSLKIAVLLLEETAGRNISPAQKHAAISFTMLKVPNLATLITCLS